MKIIDSPREGMQGFSRLLSAADKAGYIDRVLRVGFDTVETGSIVSPKLIPQMADSLEVLGRLDRTGIHSKIMFLAVNERGAGILAGVQEVDVISYPFSFSPTFLKLNVNSTVDQSFDTTLRVASLCAENGKEAVIYISMAFGNPYGDPWSPGLLAEWVGRLRDGGVRTIPLSNVSTEISAEQIHDIFSLLIPLFPDVEFGLHLHTANEGWYDKVDAAWKAGCRRFDGVINGWGGCPMAGKKLLGNLKTENLLLYAAQNNIPLQTDPDALLEVYRSAREVFGE